jgi:hypothetical protein
LRGAQSIPPPCTHGGTRELPHRSSQHLKLEMFTNCRTVSIIGVPADIRTRRPLSIQSTSVTAWIIVLSLLLLNPTIQHSQSIRTWARSIGFPCPWD